VLIPPFVGCRYVASTVDARIDRTVLTPLRLTAQGSIIIDAECAVLSFEPRKRPRVCPRDRPKIRLD